MFVGVVFLFVSVIGQNTAEIRRVLEITDSLYSLGKVDSALIVCRQAAPLVRQEKNPGAIVSFYTSQGVYLRSSGMLPDAVKSYDTALEYVGRLDTTSEDDRQSAVVLYNNLSTLHMDMKSLDKSEEYALLAVSLADKCTDKLFAHRFIPSPLLFLLSENFMARLKSIWRRRLSCRTKKGSLIRNWALLLIICWFCRKPIVRKVR